MRQIRLGKTDVQTPVIGLGCMGMSEFYGAHDDDQSLATLARAAELGVTMFDTSNVYGRGHNESLIGRFLKGRRREDFTLCTKFGVVRDPEGPEGSTYDRGVDNSPAYMRQCLEESLQRLGTDYVDLYYIHRADPNADIAETVGAMGEMVKAGKIRAIGLSEVTADVLRQAHAAHPISALQSEYSLWTREPERDVLPACKDLGVTFVAYSPLGRGLFTGAVTEVDTTAQNDIRLTSPRFRGENFEQNKRLVDVIREVADAKGCKPGQVALAWLLHRDQDVVPIPGTKRVKYLEENAAAADVRLDAADLAALDEAFPLGVAAGDRYDPSFGTSWQSKQA
jgi:aryl-alcohol dehydrogenase-like predicted oxidoreductase